MKAPEPNWRRWPFRLMLAAIFVLAAITRFYRFGDYCLWLDESHTWFFSRASWDQLLPTLRIIGVHPPFYFALEKLAVGWLGEGESGLRILSVIFDLSSISLAAYLGWISAKATGAILAVWFWAFNPFTIWFAQEARPYALAALLSLGVLILFLQAHNRPSTGLFLASGVLMALGLMTHFFFILVLGATTLLALFEIRQKPLFFREWTLVCLAALIPLALWLTWLFLLSQPVISIGWITFPEITDLPLTVWNFFSGYAGILSPASTLFGLTVGSLVIVGSSFGEQASWNRSLFLAGILLPLLGTWLVSFWRPIYIDRYYIVLLPFLLPPLASGGDQALRWVGRFHSKTIALAMLGVLLLGVGWFNAWQVHSDLKYRREDWRGLTGYLSGHKPSDTPFWFLHMEMIAPFEYYYRRPYQTQAAGLAPACREPCWWVLRQPYTTTHAFTQAITDPARPWQPELPTGCQILERWDSLTGIAIWKIDCQ